jgi:hypothetical protein
MISIAILAIALVVLTRTVTGDVRATHHSRMLTAATFLARTKISSIEQNILEIGFSEMEGEDVGDFTEEGFPASSGTPPSSGSSCPPVRPSRWNRRRRRRPSPPIPWRF